MTKERKFKKEYARELIRLAENDLVAAQTLRTNKLVRAETMMYLLQQAVEKSLKALLIAQERPVPLVHDIAMILDRLKDSSPFSPNLRELSDFASIRRYEEGTFDISEAEIEAVFVAVHSSVDHCVKAIHSMVVPPK